MSMASIGVGRRDGCIAGALVLIVLSLTSIVLRAGAEEMGEAVADAASEEPWLGLLDYALLALLGGGGAYYYLMKMGADKPTEIPQYKIQQTLPPVLARQTSSDKSFIRKMQTSERRFVVFYGSQTGTAEEFAGRLAKEGARYGLKGMVADPEEIEMDDLECFGSVEEVLEAPCLAVFCMATYGEGDPTDNAQDFFDWIQEDHDLSGMRYAVFGLGNKTYEHYNKMAKFTDTRLAELGAKRIFPLGLGDDDANLEDDFITWKESFWMGVCETFDISATGEEVSMRQYEANVLAEGDFNPDKIYTGEAARLKSFITQRPPFDIKNPFMSKIKVNRALHSSTSDRFCFHIELDISDSRIRYDAGDHVAVYARNDEELVKTIGEKLQIDLDTVFTMVNLDEDATKRHPFPCPTTYRTALTYYVDITALPRTFVIKELAEYASDPAEKAQLQLMATPTPEGKELYAAWVVNACRHIAHILEDLPSLRPPPDHLLELLPRLQPRFYSISSSSRLHKDNIHITGVVVEYKTPTGRTNKGVATTWLKTMMPSPEEDAPVWKIPVFVRRSQFRLPNRPQTPVIMIGPGTGLAPFRGFIQERAWQKEQGKPVGPTHMYFGCRRKDSDFIYRDELESYVSSGLLTLYTAFSRDQDKKVYVTHRMHENAAEIWQLVGEQNGHVYICGDAKMMAKDVTRILVDEVLGVHGKMSGEEAADYFQKMNTQKRFSADVWS